MQDDNQWEECPVGLVTGMASKLRSQRRTQQLRPVFGAGLLLVLAIAIGYSFSGAGSSPSRSKLTCAETVPLLADFHDNSLDEAVVQDIQTHLSDCPSCRDHYDELYPSEVRSGAAADSNIVAALIPFAR